MANAHDIAHAPLRSVRLGSRLIDVERRSGAVYLRLRENLQPYPLRMTDRLIHWAHRAPDRIFLAEQRADKSWYELCYGDALHQVRRIGQWLLDAGLSVRRPLILLSENDIPHALFGLAALHVGVPFVPVSPAYSQLADLQRLRYVVDLIEPGVAYALDRERYARALHTMPAGTRCVTRADFDSILTTEATVAVDQAHAQVNGSTLGKVLFTSGSTDLPKGVLFPNAMLCSNCQQVAQTMAFVQDDPPVMVDWLPWHHTFGGTHNLGLALYNGGSFYIDPGRPTPEGIGPTVELLSRISPTLYFNTPQGYEVLIPHLQTNERFRRSFFCRLKLLFYGAARLPENLWQTLDELSVQVLGERVLISSGIGSTEAGPSPTFTPWDPGRKPIVGVPVAGVTLKVAPVNGKLEMRFKGDCVTPGYWRDPGRTEAAFDDEGYFRMGDAVAFIDDEKPELGLRFDGRLADNFKLSSGTWVDVAALRKQLVAEAAPYLLDAVIAGHNQGFVSALLFPNYEMARGLDPALRDLSPQAVVTSAAVRCFFQDVLNRLARRASGSSRLILRASLECDPPLLQTGELSDKNAISQAAVLRRRASTVDVLYAPKPAESLLVADRSF